MNFSENGENWIKGFLSYGRAFIIVNGSTSNEFPIKSGGRQGGPFLSFHFVLAMETLNILLSFLFVLAMEALRISLKEAFEQHVFQGISIPNNGPHLSHFLYVDDATLLVNGRS